MKRLSMSFLIALVAVAATAQPAQIILNRGQGSITFAVDEVEPPTRHCGFQKSGSQLAADLHRSGEDIFQGQEPTILANSFADAGDLYDIGEDVVFQMLLHAWCQHRPVVLSPDVIWLLVCQQFSHYVNQDPERVRNRLVSHEGKKDLEVDSNDLLSDQADWTGLIHGFTSEIAKYSNGGIASSLVADFSTTGVDERIASEVTLMDVVKPYFEYIAVYAVCGIPSITLTGTPEDWRSILDKSRSLKGFGLDWWLESLDPILEEFVRAAEGKPDYWFWKDMVKKSRPRTIQGPTCAKKPKAQTRFDGWFLKFFPFDSEGRTTETVSISHNMLAETVAVPFTYKVVDLFGNTMESHSLELVAGIVGVQQDPLTFAMCPKIGWFVRSADTPVSVTDALPSEEEITMDSSVRYWDDGPLSLSDFSSRRGELPKICEFEYGISFGTKSWKQGNTEVRAPEFRASMNPYSSWIHPDYRGEGMLQYLQTGFDYVEICRRRAQREAMKGSAFGINSVVKFHLDVADSFLAKMKDETMQGLDTTAVRAYSSRVKSELGQTEDVKYTDLIFNPHGFGLGMHAGIGSEFYTGSLTSWMTPITGIDFGFDFDFSNVNLYLDGLLGWGGRLKQDIPRKDYQWEAGKAMKGGSMNISLGYTVHDSQWWKIAPFAGIGVGFIDYPSNPADPDKDSDESSGFRYQAGLCADLKYRRIVEYLSGPQGLSEMSVRFRLFAAHTAFATPAPAWSINFGISANLLALTLKH